jgi:hypothetical protein
VLPLDQFEQQRLVASRAPWVIYETMPADRYDIFAGLSDDELKKRVPPQSVEEYLRHGKDVTTDDAAVRKLGLDETGKPLAPEDTATPAKEVYQRRLRDYAQEFEELSRRRVAMEVAKAETAADIARLTVALSTAKEMQAAKSARGLAEAQLRNGPPARSRRISFDKPQQLRAVTNSVVSASRIG